MNRPNTIVVVLALVALAGCAGDEPETEVAEVPVGAETAPAVSTTPAPPASTGLLNANDATRDELVAAGLTNETADAVVAGRPYDGVAELDQALAAQLDEAGRATVYRSVWIPLDLNTATEEEMLLIPDAGPRMVHEFEEYRPYTDIEQFRREIGKYVDQAEVARLEQYFVLR